MHVGFVGGRAPITPERRGAIEKLVMDYAAGMSARGHEATVFTVGSDPGSVRTAEGVTLVTITTPIERPPSHVVPAVRFGRRLTDAVRDRHRESQFDVLHAHFYPHLIGFDAPEDVPTVVTEHNAHPWRREQEFIPELDFLHGVRWELDTQIRRLEARVAFRKARRVFSVSNAHGEWIDRTVPNVSGRRTTMYNFVQTGTYTPDATPSGSVELPDGPVALYAGRKVPHKGLHRAVEALAEVERPVQLAVLGPIGDGFDSADGLPKTTSELDPYLRRVVAVARDRGVEDRITFIGYVPDGDLPAYYAAADVTVFPSVLESFGMIPIESMACGTPPVVHDVPPMTETVVDGETGRRVAVSSVAIARGIEDVLDGSMEQSARTHVKAEFGPDERIAAQIDAYRSVSTTE